MIEKGCLEELNDDSLFLKTMVNNTQIEVGQEINKMRDIITECDGNTLVLCAIYALSDDKENARNALNKCLKKTEQILWNFLFISMLYKEVTRF